MEDEARRAETGHEHAPPVRASVLVVDDDGGMRRMIQRGLGQLGYRVAVVETGEEALTLFEAEDFDLVVSDIVMSPMDGLEFLVKLRETDQRVPVVMITAYGTVESAVEAMKRGASDYIAKPFNVTELTLVLEKALDRMKLLEERAYLREEISRHYDFHGIVGQSARMKRVFEIAGSVSRTNANVLITGESGTGKELLARSIHFSGERKNQPFIVLNCGAMPEGVLESELFGHERGAFTGAHRQRKGRFELADGGTLFIDEVGELAPSSQVRLLRVLQEREFERVGGDQTISVDVRIIAATNKQLRGEVEAGRFREDLFYRLNVVELPLPPLRERREDIEPMALYFLERYMAETRKRVTGYAPLALEVLTRYDWPGNVRELENVVERAVVLARGELIQPGDLPMGFSGEKRDIFEVTDGPMGLTEMIEELEKKIILSTLEKTGGGQTEAAKLLGVARTTLRYKMEKYELVEGDE